MRQKEGLQKTYALVFKSCNHNFQFACFCHASKIHVNIWTLMLSIVYTIHR